MVPVLVLWSAAALTLGRGVDEFIKDTLFSWLPDWYVLSADYSQYGRQQLVITFISALFVVGIIAPVVEELYFRGYLLPRMEWVGNAAPVVNAFPFSLYHFWSPWQVLSRTVALIPFCYVTYRTKSIRVAIIVHCLLNVLGDAVGVLVHIL